MAWWLEAIRGGRVVFLAATEQEARIPRQGSGREDFNHFKALGDLHIPSV